MGQRRVELSLTETQAKVVRAALERYVTVTPLRNRGVDFERRANETMAIVSAACAGIDPLPPTPLRLNRRPR